MDPDYDPDHDAACGTLPGSPLDRWAGTDIADSGCTAKATWVIVERKGESADFVCDVHARAWIDHDQPYFAQRLHNPVSDADVAAAIASIQTSIRT